MTFEIVPVVPSKETREVVAPFRAEITLPTRPVDPQIFSAPVEPYVISADQ